MNYAVRGLATPGEKETVENLRHVEFRFPLRSGLLFPAWPRFLLPLLVFGSFFSLSSVILSLRMCLFTVSHKFSGFMLQFRSLDFLAYSSAIIDGTQAV